MKIKVKKTTGTALYFEAGQPKTEPVYSYGFFKGKSFEKTIKKQLEKDCIVSDVQRSIVEMEVDADELERIAIILSETPIEVKETEEIE